MEFFRKLLQRAKNYWEMRRIRKRMHKIDQAQAFIRDQKSPSPSGQGDGESWRAHQAMAARSNKLAERFTAELDEERKELGARLRNLGFEYVEAQTR